ncbi:MAG TPA: peptidylprolyl isomerase [Chlamydiales bacterium]|nr:peptidylprolyl isomerase [Chlamydiales bacterium]
MKYLPYLLLTFSCFAAIPPVDFSDTQQIAVQNSILAKVNGHTISVLDVKKKMDVAFHKNYPQYANSAQARFQFYDTSWRHVLMEMIDQQLMLTEAESKQIPLGDGEIRQEMETRFGPNIMLTLDKIGLSYDEAWKILKDELIVQRMSWWFIQSKAMNQVTPQDIRQAYRIHIKENPAFDELKYRVIVIRGENAEERASQMHKLLTEKALTTEFSLSLLQELDPTVQVSAEFSAKDKELSDAHKNALTSLSPGTYSKPVVQKNKSDNQPVARIFYLSEKTIHPAPQFENLAFDLRNELIQKAVVQESAAYLEKLRKSYPFDENIPKDFHPFTLH